MKKLLVLALFCSSFVYANELHTKKALLDDIKEQTKKCSVQIVAPAAFEGDNDQVVGFKSVCKTLVIVSDHEARLLIDSEWVTATIKESAESDGGDLDDLVITNSAGKVLAVKSNIPAYDSIIVAMAGTSAFKRREYQ